MFFMRILGTLFNTQNGITSIFDSVYLKPEYQKYKIIMSDIIFPMRDFLEVIMFSYLFYYQSKKRKNIDKINERYLKLIQEETQPTKKFVEENQEP